MLSEHERVTDGRPVWVAGHSLGAAMATLHSADLLRALHEGTSDTRLSGLITFGSPRAGDRVFRDQMHDLALTFGVSMLRVRNGNDIVTALPNTIDSIGWGYAHVGPMLRMDNDEEPVFMPNPRDVPTPLSAPDHDSDHYWDALRSPALTEFASAFDRCAID